MQIILSVLAIAVIGFIFRKAFPSKEKIQSTDVYEVNKMMNLFWLILFFVSWPLITYFFFNIFRLIQFYIIGIDQYEGFDVLISDSILLIPVGFFSLCIGTLMFFKLFFSKKFILERLEGLEEGKKKEYYRATMGELGYGSFDPEKGEIFLLILGIIFLVPALLSADSYIKIDKQGIIDNSWLSLGEENFYSLSEVGEIYSIKGSILKTNTYKKYNSPYYLIKFNNGHIIRIDGNFYNLFGHTEIETMNYISEKSGKNIECKISGEKYVDCVEEAEIMKKYPLEKED